MYVEFTVCNPSTQSRTILVIKFERSPIEWKHLMITDLLKMRERMNTSNFSAEKGNWKVKFKEQEIEPHVDGGIYKSERVAEEVVKFSPKERIRATSCSSRDVIFNFRTTNITRSTLVAE